ncbi:hypothetical protein HPB51_019130 [Rhipicephalus microplus]|uniref:Uncharacterized protein n=1 Tax=Rhipicephalus microplus TaxID=6941 RepID=A0A9J6DWL6_RHIMP|nr:hypothetical protein HPB51_019130 [Rhipicephalus microplus]
MSNSKCKLLRAGKSNISSSKSAEGEDEFKADEVFDHETGKPKLPKQGAVDLMTQLGRPLVFPKVPMILDMQGTITAFLDHSPLFEVIFEYPSTLAYYNCTDDEDDCVAEIFTEFLNDGILQVAIAADSVRQGKSVLSSDSSVCMSSGGGGDNEPATCRTKNASSQIPSLRLHH